MAFNQDHEHYVMKNRALAGGYNIDRKDKKFEKKGVSPLEREPSCFNCKLKQKCPDFRGKRSGGTSGVVSFGGGNESMLCDRYVPAPFEKRGMSDKQIKSLMKGFKRRN